jgi:hypothetical protein
MSETAEELPAIPAPETTANDDEKTLLEEFAKAKVEVEELTAKLDISTKHKNAIEERLIRLLEDDDKQGTAPYNGLGYAIIVEGAAYASIEKGRADDVMAYLVSIAREDMIKTSVHSATLSSYVRECLKENKDIPPGTTFYKPKGLRFYPAK